MTKKMAPEKYDSRELFEMYDHFIALSSIMFNQHFKQFKHVVLFIFVKEIICNNLWDDNENG